MDKDDVDGGNSDEDDNSGVGVVHIRKSKHHVHQSFKGLICLLISLVAYTEKKAKKSDKTAAAQ